MVQQFGAMSTGGAVASILMLIASIDLTKRTLPARHGITILDIAGTSRIVMPTSLSASGLPTARLLVKHIAAKQRRAAVTWRRKLARLLLARLLKPKLALRPSPGLLPRRRSKLARPSLLRRPSLRRTPIAPEAQKLPVIPQGHSTLAGQELQAISLRRESTHRRAMPKNTHIAQR